MDFLLIALSFFVGCGVGFFVAAVLATAAHDDECARCWQRLMRDVRPKDY